MYVALPRSEYYGDSAPSTPSAGIAPIHSSISLARSENAEFARTVPTFAVVRSTG
jgi:hypothetical protein